MALQLTRVARLLFLLSFLSLDLPFYFDVVDLVVRVGELPLGVALLHLEPLDVFFQLF